MAIELYVQFRVRTAMAIVVRFLCIFSYIQREFAKWLQRTTIYTYIHICALLYSTQLNSTLTIIFFFVTEKQELSNCVGCGRQIHDQYILRVAPDLEWHAACLKCQECRQFLDERCTCFVRDGKTYCKRDYVRYVLILTRLWVAIIRIFKYMLWFRKPIYNSKLST